MNQPADPPANDERYALLLSEAIRRLQRQDATLDNIRARAGTLLATASLAASFLGAATYGKSHLSNTATGSVIVAVAALVIVLACVIAIQWPREWEFSLSSRKLITDYLDPPDPADLTLMRRDLSMHFEDAHGRNEDKLDDLWLALRIASVAVVVEVLAWVLALKLR